MNVSLLEKLFWLLPMRDLLIPFPPQLVLNDEASEGLCFRLELLQLPSREVEVGASNLLVSKFGEARNQLISKFPFQQLEKRQLAVLQVSSRIVGLQLRRRRHEVSKKQPRRQRLAELPAQVGDEDVGPGPGQS